MLIFDIETNGLLEDTTQLHCMAVHDTATGKTIGFDPSTVQNGVRLLIDALAQGETITGHNIIAFDLPVLTKLYPDYCLPRAARAGIGHTHPLAPHIFQLGDHRPRAYAQRTSPLKTLQIPQS